MVTERQIAANRENSRRSGGPRSQAGKRRSSRNSFQHGLSKPSSLGSADHDWIERFVRAATEGDRTLVTLELARSAAMAHLDVLRVRQTRAAILKQLDAALEKEQATRSSIREQRDEIAIALLRLDRIDRYEQRSAWRRNKALRRIFEAGRAAQPDAW